MENSYIDELEEKFNDVVEDGSSEVANWALKNVPQLIDTLRAEKELADMYRGLSR